MRYLLFILLTSWSLQAQVLTEDTNLDITLSWSQFPNGYTYPVSIIIPEGETPDNGFPACILLHGNGGNGAQMAQSFSEVLECHILIAPTGYANSWSICNEESTGPDVDMVSQLVDLLKGFDNVDETRIRLLGGSNGSGLVNNIFIQNDDPAIDRVCGFVSQLNEPQYHEDAFYYPTDEPLPTADFCGYEHSKTPLAGRKYLSICNDNDNLIPFAGGPSPVGVSFLPAELAIYLIAQSQGYAGDALPPGGVPVGSPLIFEYVYLDGDVILVRGNANHGLNSAQTAYIKDFFEDCSTEVGITTFPVESSIFYPNPCSDILYLNTPISTKSSFTIFDLNGRIIHSGQVEAGVQSIHLAFLGKGVYWIQLGESNKKIIKL